MSQIIIRHLGLHPGHCLKKNGATSAPHPTLSPLGERRKVREECCQNFETYFQNAT
jgi:hypothetical protein